MKRGRMEEDLSSILDRRKQRNEVKDSLSWMRLEDRLKKEKSIDKTNIADNELNEMLKCRREKERKLNSGRFSFDRYEPDKTVSKLLQGNKTEMLGKDSSTSANENASDNIQFKPNFCGLKKDNEIEKEIRKESAGYKESGKLNNLKERSVKAELKDSVKIEKPKLDIADIDVTAANQMKACGGETSGGASPSSVKLSADLLQVDQKEVLNLKANECILEKSSTESAVCNNQSYSSREDSCAAKRKLNSSTENRRSTEDIAVIHKADEISETYPKDILGRSNKLSDNVADISVAVDVLPDASDVLSCGVNVINYNTIESDSDSKAKTDSKADISAMSERENVIGSGLGIQSNSNLDCQVLAFKCDEKVESEEQSISNAYRCRDISSSDTYNSSNYACRNTNRDTSADTDFNEDTCINISKNTGVDISKNKERFKDTSGDIEQEKETMNTRDHSEVYSELTQDVPAASSAKDFRDKADNEAELWKENENDEIVETYEITESEKSEQRSVFSGDSPRSSRENPVSSGESPLSTVDNHVFIGDNSISSGESPDSRRESLESTGESQESRRESVESADAESDSSGDMDGRIVKSQSFRTTSSISDRLAQLQKSGEEGWKRRLGGSQKDLTSTGASLSRSNSRQKSAFLSVNDNTTPLVADQTSGVVLRRDGARSQPSVRPTSIADRLSLLQTSQSTWRGRVEEKDTKQFTVEGKINRLGIAVDSPLSRRQRGDVRLRDSESSGASSEPESPVKQKSAQPNISITSSSSSATDTSHPSSNGSGAAGDAVRTDDSTQSDSSPVKVIVPVFDDLSAFFSHPPSGEKIVVTVDDFDELFINSNDMLQAARKIKPRRANQGSRNPLKTLSMVVDVQHEYTDVRTDIAERELKRVTRERVVGTPQLAQEALAGLASVENFSKVALRKADSFHGTGAADLYRPYSQLMLLSVKGRRFCQTRLVEPRSSSVNSGDCYLLVTPDVITLWIGEFSNIIERSKASDLANQIHQRHDLGTRSTCQLYIVDEEKQTVMRSAQKFWRALGEDTSVAAQPPGHSEEDELYESYMNETNRVHEFVGDKLCLSNELSGVPLKYSMLHETKVLVFDFGCEFYVWTGKQVSFDKRKRALSLAKEIFDSGYDYTDCSINPISPLLSEEKGGALKSCAQRPSWAIFGKVSQNMETSLFKEKFTDWPDASKVVKVKTTHNNYSNKVDMVSDLKPVDAKTLLVIDDSPVTLVLEGSHVGRGAKWVETIDGIKWEYEIVTKDVNVWHVAEGGCQKLDKKSYGQFHECDSYVIRWKYAINQLTHKLKTEESRISSTGRSRCAYFFWQGRHSSVNEKGAAALMTVELDQDKGPQIRVPQGSEPPCFTNLFSGNMIVHCGHRSDVIQQACTRLYTVRNELPSEAYLLEVSCVAQSLRSRSSFVLVNERHITVWHGSKSPSHVIKRAKECAKNLQDSCPVEIGLKCSQDLIVTEIEEGMETKEFWSLLSLKRDRSIYGSLIHDGRLFNYTPRLFHMSSQSGTFEVTEVKPPAINHKGLCTPFPFLQSDIYSADQPALFMLDNEHEVYLWQGWWPIDDSEESDHLRTGYALPRFNVDRKCAMQTCIQYCQERNPDKPLKSYIVFAGCEPTSFTSLFPRWEVDETVQQIASKEGRVPGMIDSVEEVLSSLVRTRYTFIELKQRPLPDGVDPLKLEAYLSDEEFNASVGMTRSEFNALPVWQQTKAKQSAGLF